MAYKCQKITFSVLLGVSAAVFLFFAAFLNIIIKNGVKQSAMLKEESVDLWGQLPGKSKVDIIRDHYFYNITDKEQFIKDIKSNKNPTVKETAPYTVSEWTNFTNREYLEDKKLVKFHYYKRLYERSEQEKERFKDIINIFNLPAVGVWYQAKNIPRASIALTGLYTVYTGLLYDFYYQACHQALADNTYKTKQDFQKEFIKKLSYLPQSTIDKLYDDPKYGFKNQNGYFTKVFLQYKSAKELDETSNFKSTDFNFFMNYFELSYFEMRYFYDLITVIVDNLLSVARDFLSKDHSYINIANNQWVNIKMVPGSIFGKNSTIPGYVEYGAYLKEVRKDYESKMPIEKVKSLMALNDFKTKLPLVDDSKSLFNKENMDIIMDDSNSREKSISLLKQRCDIEDDVEAGYLIDYLQFIVDEIALQSSTLKSKDYQKVKDAKESAAMATFISQGMYQVVSGIGQILLDNIAAKEAFINEFKDKKCEDVLADKLYPDTNIEEVCKNPKLDTSNPVNVRYFWYGGIMGQDKTLKTLLGYDTEKFYYIINKYSAMYQLFNKYVVSTMKKYELSGNDYETVDIIKLGTIQFFSGEITKKEFDKDSVKDFVVEGKAFTKTPEYASYLKEEKIDTQYKLEQFLDNMNYDKFFSQIFIQKIIISYKNKNIKESNNDFILGGDEDNFANEEFIEYLRRLMLNEVMGGIIVTKTVNDLIWGYNDHLLTMVKNNNYYLGGDPSLDTLFSFGRNMTEPKPTDENKWVYYTGIDNADMARQTKTAFGYDRNFIYVKEPYFNGREVVSKFRNPWKIEIPLNGTDSVQFKPLLNTTYSPWVFADDFLMKGSATYLSTKYYNGFYMNRYKLDDSLLQSSKFNKYNENFYMDKYNGFGNQTSVLKAPMFLSKPYYKSCDDMPQLKVDITKYRPKSHDIPCDDKEDCTLYEESFLDIETYSGMSLRAGQKILTSLLIEKDVLFNYPDEIFIPAFYVNRGGNVTLEGTNAALGDLKTAWSVQLWGTIISALLAGVFIGLLIYYVRKKDDAFDTLTETILNKD